MPATLPPPATPAPAIAVTAVREWDHDQRSPAGSIRPIVASARIGIRSRLRPG